MAWTRIEERIVTNTPIGDYGLLSDCHSAALIDRGGSIDWWCAPRFDSPSVFGRIVGDGAGHFRIGVSRPARQERRYLDGTLTLETTSHAETGVLVATDCLAMAPGVRGHDLGRSSPHQLLRGAECRSGRVEVDIEIVPRLEYGLTIPRWRRIDGGYTAVGGPVTIRVHTTVDLEIDTGGAYATVGLEEGEAIWVAVGYSSSWEEPPPPVRTDRIPSMVSDTNDAWRSWRDEHQRYDGPFRDAVELSGRVLQGLTYTPTGAIVAAPTTSLPETVGGGRNWDYRFSWVRDASFTIHSLWVAACPDEERHFFSFLSTAASSVHHRDQLQIMFGVSGERDLTERELPWLSGWRDSRPVRVGNGAWNQRQNDVYGELLSAAHRLHDQLDWSDDAQRSLLVTLADLAATVWTERDQGMWEMRDEPRHHLSSKLMCWVALDRAVSMAGELRAGDRLPRWKETREEIRRAILTEGWSDRVGAFTQSFGSDALDAAALMIPLVGFLAGTDHRVLATIDAVERELMDPSGLVLRYRGADGLEGDEGGFVFCTFWLAQAHAMAGDVERAREVFASAVAYANDLGLLSEEVDLETGALIGNYPQAFSHIGLINAAWAISEAERRTP